MARVLLCHIVALYPKDSFFATCAQSSGKIICNSEQLQSRHDDDCAFASFDLFGRNSKCDGDFEVFYDSKI